MREPGNKLKLIALSFLVTALALLLLFPAPGAGSTAQGGSHIGHPGQRESREHIHHTAVPKEDVLMYLVHCAQDFAGRVPPSLRL